MNVRRSAFHRARRFVRNVEYQQTLEEMGLPEGTLASHEMLETLRTVKRYVPKGATLLDIGAHRGEFTKTAHAAIDLRRSICFEPNTDLHPVIASAVQGFDSKIVGIALSGEEGQKAFFHHEDDSMNSTVEADADVLRNEFPWDNPDVIRASSVPTTTLDSFMKSERDEAESFFVKIDTQGNELDILRHGVETLKQTSVIVAEHMFLTPYRSSYSFLDLLGFLAMQGFSAQGALTISKRPSGLVSAVDFLFCRDSD